MYLPDIPDRDLSCFLHDDVALGDLTTHALGIGPTAGRMTFVARDPMTIACCEEAERILGLAGCKVERHVASGDRLAEGTLILAARGPAGALHRGWKVAQTLVEIASGMATNAAAIVAAARAARPGTSVVCTRKSVPGVKAMSIKAIMAGGAMPHRLGLSETILIFDNHRTFLGSEQPTATIARLKAAAPEKKIMVEVETLSDAITWCRAGTDVIQLDKASPNLIAELVTSLADEALSAVVSAAGGINADNAGAYAAAGAAALVTSAPYTAKPLDVSVKITPAHEHS